MATKQPKTPPKLQPARVETTLPVAALIPTAVSGVGDRGTEQNVPFTIDGAGRKFVAAPHPQAGAAW
jgi:hypothetical protein